jgi:hypothetical protein
MSKKIVIPKEEEIIVREGKILVKEFVQGLIVGFLAGALMAWFALA